MFLLENWLRKKGLGKNPENNINVPKKSIYCLPDDFLRRFYDISFQYLFVKNEKTSVNNYHRHIV